MMNDKLDEDDIILMYDVLCETLLFFCEWIDDDDENNVEMKSYYYCIKMVFVDS